MQARLPKPLSDPGPPWAIHWRELSRAELADLPAAAVLSIADRLQQIADAAEGHRPLVGKVLLSFEEEGYRVVYALLHATRTIEVFRVRGVLH